MPSLSDILLGKPASYEKVPSGFSPEQMNVLQQILGMGAQGLGTGAIEENARRGFKQNTVPLLSERFAAQNATGSSGYQNALQGAGTELESRLAALRQGNANNLLQLGLTPTQDYRFIPQGQGLAAPLIGAGADVLSAFGPTGASSIIDLFKSLFGGGNQGQQQTPNSYTGVQAEATTPLRNRLSQQSGRQLAMQGAQNSLGLGPKPRDQFEQNESIRTGGLKSILDLIGHHTLSGLGQTGFETKFNTNQFGTRF